MDWADNVPMAGKEELEKMKPCQGKMRLDYKGGIGAWQDVANILIASGYEVTLRLDEGENEPFESYVIEIEYREV